MERKICELEWVFIPGEVDLAQPLPVGKSGLFFIEHIDVWP